MKPHGTVLSFTHERNAALLKAYRQQIAAVSFIRLEDIGEKIVNSPAPRFWVSEERATTVVSAMMQGKSVLDSMRDTKREMFQEIYRRVLVLKKVHPDWPLSRLVFDVVNSPAPKFYMKASSALERLFKIRKAYRHANGKEHNSF